MFNFIRRSIKRNFGIDKEYYRFIDDMFGFIPNNIELYKVALIHKSASQSIGGHHINNERLEYLGDAVIESITSDYLFIAYPDQNEGFLTQMRSKIVSRQSLNEMAVFIGLDKYLICKSGATLQQKHIYGDAFEAMMGAIYLDQGYDFTNRLLINDIYEKFLSIDELSEEENDFKSRLIEWCQKNRHNLEFKTRKDNDKKSGAPVFYTTVLIDGIEMGHGIGDSKKSSEQNAACSLSREMSDEECAKLLDKVDKMMNKLAPQAPAPVKKETKEEARAEQNGGRSTTEETHEGEGPKEHKHRRNKRRKGERPAVENTPSGENAEEQAAQPIQPAQPAPAEDVKEVKEDTAAPAESAAEQQPAKKPRTRRKRAESAQNVAETAPAEVVDKAEETTESTDKAAEEPAKKRRTRRKKSETAATADAPVAEAEASVKGAEEPQAAEQPAKKRRVRRKKNETSETSEPAAVSETAAE